MTYIAIKPQQEGFGSFKLPSTAQDWAMFHLFVRYHKENGHYLGMKK